MKHFLIIVIVFITFGCGSDVKKQAVNNNEQIAENRASSKKLFTKIATSESGLTFKNQLTPETEDLFFNYQYIFNGAGVGVADFNNDGLTDIFMVGNEVTNTLYLNKGNMRFEDISASAGIQAVGKWCNGITIADVNGDGFADIYISSSAHPKPEGRENLLYINNGDLTFTEKAKELGVNDSGYSSQAAFLDFDLDGDLDLYVANHANSFEQENIVTKNVIKPREPENSDQFYINENGKFRNASEEVGLIYEALLGFGLGVATGDFDENGYLDIYISNDYDSPDFLYMNNGDGTFTQNMKKHIKHVSQFSMGNDAADFNNDGHIDIITLDMVAEDNKRNKTQMGGMNPEKFYAALEFGLPAQYMYNALQLNNGSGDFSDVAQMAGVSSTDWSWTSLFADLDNDGWKDLYITNGYRVDARDKDFLIENHKLGNSESGYARPPGGINELPSTPLPNYAYGNNKDLTFKKRSYEWGLADKGFSMGAAFADFDNDGDLDLVVNNLNDDMWLYQNNINEINQSKYLRVSLIGTDNNKMAIGSKVNIYFTDGTMQTQQLTTTRGYQSSSDPILHFGYDKSISIAKAEVIWATGEYQEMKNLQENTLIKVSKLQKATVKNPTKNATFFNSVDPTSIGINFTHTENKFDDFEKEILLPHRNSMHGPGLFAGDVNGDGLDDFYVGGAAGQKGKLFIQNSNSTFDENTPAALQDDFQFEDMGGMFIDYDSDGDQDIYIVSGGNEFAENSVLLQDRLYENQGNGVFSQTTGILPEMNTSGQIVAANDFDSDGDLDLFVGGRLIPGKYPFAPRSYLLVNEGGKFIDKTSELAPEILRPGLVTDAKWADMNNDGANDLIIAGEWMQVLVLMNTDAKLKKSKDQNLADNVGWWSAIEIFDLDNNGYNDIIAGNLGLNYKYKASQTEPFHIYCSDFDNSGSLDIVLGYYNDGVCYPVRGRQCSSQQMPFIKKKFPSYNNFGDATINDVYGDKLKESLHYSATNFASSVVYNNGESGYYFESLNNYAQTSCINAIQLVDANQDQIMDIVAVGNLFESEVETPRNDASNGLVLINNGNKSFKFQAKKHTGFLAKNDAKNMIKIKLANNNTLLIIANNNDVLSLVSYLSTSES